ncbi:MAG: sulfatase-like hydrolase/transferase [Deltaproteobacteria bacterium]|nr:sulfatase-like hydrolase/transferase [Deltaproteobacteria bacterium]
MSPPFPRSPFAWVIVAHTIGAAIIGALEAARLGSSALAAVLVPLFAITGLLVGLLVGGAERIVRGRTWWVVALVVAAPSLLISGPVAATLFSGAFAQTLPLAGVLPFVLPLALWLGVACAVALGRRVLRGGDRTSRAIVILASAGAIGGLVWFERNLLKSGYPDAHAGATFAVIVLAGVALRVARTGSLSPYIAAAVAAAALGTGIGAVHEGLAGTLERRVLATRGDQGRDLVRVWRAIFDLDRDGSSAILGGGDCDDRDDRLHPGAADAPGDGVDQDCDGHDAIAVAPQVSAAAAADVSAWHERAEVRAVLERTKDMSILLSTIDALRADILDPATADRSEFPNLTALLDESVWFTRAFAPGSGTDISIGTLLTGRHDPFQSVQTTLPEALRETGRRTSSALPVEVNRYVGETLLTRGIDRVKPVYTDWGSKDIGDHVSAKQTTLEGLRALDAAAGAKTFVWVHYFDVHEHHQIEVPKELRSAVSPNGSEKRHVYRALLFAIDKEIGRLRGELTSRGLADKTIIVLASDHGESLGDDPRLGVTHGKVTYAPLVRIPIALRIPGVAGGKRTDAVSLVDLAPTLLGLIGQRTAMAPLDGLDLLPSLLDGPAALRPRGRAIVIQEELQWSVVEWPHQLIVRPADDLVELYDLERDPAEKTDLSTKLPDVVSRLKARYSEAPRVRVDRTIDGRKWRERQAQRPPPRAPQSGSAATSTP